MSKKDEKIIQKLHSDKAPKKYQGKEVAVVAGKVYLMPEDDKKAGGFINKLLSKHPKLTPALTFVPKPGTYILFFKK